MEDKHTKEKNKDFNINIDKININEINKDNKDNDNSQIIKEDLDIITSQPSKNSKNKNNNSVKFDSNLVPVIYILIE